MKDLKQANLANKRVLLRVDYNVPLKKVGDKNKVEDSTRIKESLTTIKYILSKKPTQLIIMTHLGRPNGKIAEDLMLTPVAKELEKLLKKKVLKVGDSINAIIPDPKDAKIVMLENLRFYREEEANDIASAQKLSKKADIYVNDAFAVSHRAHMSVHAITKFLPSYPGLLLKKEYETVTNALKTPERPFVAIMGGKKVSDKIEVIQSLLNKVDTLILGGAMIFTFYRASGLEIGKSICENEKLELARNLLANSKNKIILPTDVLAADKIDENANTRNVDVKNIPSDLIGVDIGEETVLAYREIISKAKTIIWNGPLGIAEIAKFSKGTKTIAEYVTKGKKLTIVGGGDSTAVIDKLKLQKKFSFISTGGGAFLELIAGKSLPGIEVLK